MISYKVGPSVYISIPCHALKINPNTQYEKDMHYCITPLFGEFTELHIIISGRFMNGYAASFTIA